MSWPLCRASPAIGDWERLAVSLRGPRVRRESAESEGNRGERQLAAIGFRRLGSQPTEHWLTPAFCRL